MEETLSFRVGKGIGKILLDISQEDILSGNTEKAIENYTNGFGMNKFHAIQILHNRLIMEAEDDGLTVYLTDDKNSIKENESNIYNWQSIMEIHDNNLREMRKAYYNICKEFNMHCVNISYGVDFIYQYVELMNNMFDEYMKFANAYKFLADNGFIKHITFVENNIENVLEILYEFYSKNTDYDHLVYDNELLKIKKKMIEGIMTTEWGIQYFKYEILKKNIDDGYDAGWLSPDGDFYGGCGETSAMIHMNLADQLFKKIFSKNDLNLSLFGSTEDPEQYLMRNGWIKIHHNEIYGVFMNDPDGEYSYCPTEKQISEICRYADLHWRGKIYTRPQIVKPTEPVSTYKLRQMDKFKLNEIFSL